MIPYNPYTDCPQCKLNAQKALLEAEAELERQDLELLSQADEPDLNPGSQALVDINKNH
jgi:hypothetical protein